MSGCHSYIPFLKRLAIKDTKYKINNANPDNTNNVIIPTIAFLSVIPFGLLPNAAEIVIPKHVKQYLINSHI